jgi:DtxR family Mn-dependent transcriptional regulator
MPTSTVEDYLKCILLEEQAAPEARVVTGRIAAALNVAPATVTSMIKALADSGLVSYEPYSGVSLTPAGQQLALHVLRRHRLVELFLVRVMGMDWADVHEEAELLEHTVSERLIERMDEMLGYPEVDPHGDPIPSARGEVQEQASVSLLRCPLDETVSVVRVSDQNVEFLQLAEREGMKPGGRLTVLERDEVADRVLLRRSDGETLHLGFRAASKIFVDSSRVRSASQPTGASQQQ